MSEVLIDIARPDQSVIKETATILRDGGLVVLPTDTVYGLAGRLFDPVAIERIFAIKERPVAKGLIVMIADLADLKTVALQPSPAALALISRYWPGPLTIVLKAGADLPPNTLVRGKIGVRLPDHEWLRALIRSVGEPLAVTSANLSGRASPVDIAESRSDLEDRVDLILNAGPCSLGVESTVIDTEVSPIAVLREGAITVDRLMEEGIIDADR